jgi:hypothetical protein
MAQARAAPAAVAVTQERADSRGRSRRSARDWAQPSTAPSPVPASTSIARAAAGWVPAAATTAPTRAGMVKPASSPMVVALTQRR